MSLIVKVCGCRPHEGGAAGTGAGVRKPPMEETAGGGARWRVRRCGDLAAVSASTATERRAFQIDSVAPNSEVAALTQSGLAHRYEHASLIVGGLRTTASLQGSRTSSLM